MQCGSPSCIFNSRSLNNVANTHCRYVYDYINNQHDTAQLIVNTISRYAMPIINTDQGKNLWRRKVIVKKRTPLSINRRSSSSASPLSTTGSHEEALSVNRIASRACTLCTREDPLALVGQGSLRVNSLKAPSFALVTCPIDDISAFYAFNNRNSEYIISISE